METGYHGNSYLSLENCVCGQGIADLNFALIWYSIGKKIDSSWPLTDTATNKVGEGRRPSREGRAVGCKGLLFDPICCRKANNKTQHETNNNKGKKQRKQIIGHTINNQK